MSVAWPSVPLGEVLETDSRYVDAPEDRAYPKLSVKLYGRGVSLDAPADGATLKMQRHQLARSGQVILSEIWGKKGAIGMVPPEGEGALCTSHFFLFNVREDRIERGWLRAIFTANYLESQLNAEAKGTTGYAAVRPRHLLAATIPLPPLAEQRRIVARLDALAAKIGEAKRLRQMAVQECTALYRSHLGRVIAMLATDHPVERLETLSSHILDGPHITPDYLPSSEGGVPFVTVKNMVSGVLDFRDLNYITESDHRLFSKRCKVERGDVLYSKDGATRGNPCFVDTDREFSYFVSVALIKPYRDRLDGRYLCHILGSPWIRDRMMDRSRGDMIPHIVLKEIRAFPIPLPPIAEQRRLAAQFDSVRERMSSIELEQSRSDAEMRALLPSLLDRAFAGGL